MYEVMDSFAYSTTWGRSSSNERNLSPEESDEDNSGFRASTEGLDSEEEHLRQMEETLYCQMYFESSSINSRDKTDKEICSQQQNGTDSKTCFAKKNIVNAEVVKTPEERLVRRMNTEDHSGNDIQELSSVAKSSKGLKKHRKTKSDKSESLSLSLSKSAHLDGRSLFESFQNEEMIPSSLVDNDASSEVILIDSGGDVSLMSDTEVCSVEEKSTNKQTPRKKHSGKSKKYTDIKATEVIDVSDTSSDSSIFLDISSEDDIDVNVEKVHNVMSDINDDRLSLILQSLPDCDWKINNTDRFGPSSKEKLRYYNSASRARCNNCNRRGHLIHACPEPKKEKPCILCGNRGHLSHRCSKSLCFRCNQPGHVARDCDRKRAWHQDECRRCGMLGHYKSDCPDQWRQFHFTTDNDEIVKRPRMENHRKYCYNCAASGHFGHDCWKRRHDKYLKPNLPFIAKYDRSYVKSSSVKDKGHHDKESLSASVIVLDSSFELQSNIKSQNQDSSISQRSFVSHKKEKKRNGGQELDCTNLSSFAQKVKEKMLDKKSKVSGKTPKKTKKNEDSVQLLSYCPLPDTTHHSPPQQKYNTLKNNGNDSFDKSHPNHQEDDFPRSNFKAQNSFELNRMKSRSNLNSHSSFQFESISTAFEDENDSFISQSFDMQLTSTPHNLLNGHHRKEKALSVSDFQKLKDDEMLQHYYGSKQIKNAKRREKRKKRKALIAVEDKSVISAKPDGSQSCVKKGDTRKVIETERGFRVVVS